VGSGDDGQCRAVPDSAEQCRAVLGMGQYRASQNTGSEQRQLITYENQTTELVLG